MTSSPYLNTPFKLVSANHTLPTWTTSNQKHTDQAPRLTHPPTGQLC